MHGSNLQEILILLLAAVVIVTVFKRFHLSPVIGYLIAGGLVGPYGFSIIKDIENTKYIAEFGIVFLLFAIGLELTFDRLQSMRRHVFGFGTMQVFISSLIIGIIAYSSGTSAETAIIIGGGLALSSTAITLQVLQERNEQATQVGRLAFAVLILQDLAVIPLLIMLSLLNQPESSLVEVVLDAFLKAVIALVVIFLAGRQLLRPIFHAVGSLKSQELFTATTLLIVLAAAWAADQGGLSLALGAFIAGLLVAETEFRPQVETDIQPFKGILMGLYFMTIGMSIDFRLLENKIYAITWLTILLVLGKALVIALLARAFRFRPGAAINSGLVLSQGSEFAFVLFALAADQGTLEPILAQILLIVVALSMAMTPLLAALGHRLAQRLDKQGSLNLDNDEIEQDTSDLNNHIIVAGYGRVGKTVCALLAAEDMHNFIAVDTDSRTVRAAYQEGVPIYYGNASKMEILKSVGIERAKMVIVTVSKKDIAERTITAIHKAYPDMPVIARAWDREHARTLLKDGATVVVAEAFESSLMLGRAILTSIGTPEHEINRVINQFRHEEYPQSVFHSLFHEKSDG